jgi:Tfp pilus assembly protein PilV
MTGVEIAFAVCNVVATGLAAFAAVKSAKAAKEQVSVALLQKQLAQRQFVIQLWDRMAETTRINPKDPAPKDVHRAVNTLELVGLCCEGGMIDVDVIKRTFKDRYVELYDMVKACGSMPTMGNMNGVELLRENKAAMLFYDELMADIKGSGQLKKT